MKSDDESGWTTHSTTVAHRGRVTLVNHAVQLEDGTEFDYEVDESVRSLWRHS